ncbi:glycosyltransferase [Microlunatus elymi]|uniref:Glycosyltransferase n=1 Tax=Microlunatus elymi TaxID=2596828 RepID=A0A516Q0B7_9ACTN|nr:CDP-glycerol glycerophosphotransferase family protein [Microlunatus elymi]QDP96885.1 glycosyltransferase [Microlunatus elymi]
MSVQKFVRRTRQQLRGLAIRTLNAGTGDAPPQRLAKAGVKRLRSVRRAASKPAAPLVSIVIPVYNVERYLRACLDSVLTQSYTDLQVVVVDDGSPDSSVDIVREYAQRDRRVQLVRQANAGLGAARNTGARHARGVFLMFVDSDDVLPTHAIANYVRTLQKTGSDFAVAPYERMNDARTWPAAPWIRTAHREPRLRTDLSSAPDICVNAIACSKLFRRSFWEEQGFAFPEGVLYEDQALSTRIYARARQFDILDKITYRWRARDDRSSISQQNTSVADLRARLRAAKDSLAELDLPGLEHVRNTRLAQYLNNDFPQSIKASQHADDEFFQVLADGLKQLTADAEPEVWSLVSAQHRIAIALVVGGHREATTEFVGLGHSNPKNLPGIVADGKVYLDTPARQPLGLEATDPLLALADHQLGLVTSIRRAYWDEDHDFHVEGWAYIDNVDLSRCETEVRIFAVEGGTGTEFDLQVQRQPSAEVTQASKHRFANYEPSCFRATLAFSGASATLGDAAGQAEWQLWASVTSAGIHRTKLLTGVDRGGSAGRLQADFLPDGTQVDVSYSAKSGLTLTAHHPRAVVAEASIQARTLQLSVIGTDDLRPVRLELAGNRSKRQLTADFTREDDVPSARIEVPTPQIDERSDPPIDRENWTLRVVDADGGRHPIAWPAQSVPSPGSNPYLQRTQYGNIGVVDEPHGVRVDDLAVADGVLRVHGVVTGGTADDLTLQLRTSKASARAELREATGSRFVADIELVDDPWGLGALPLPIGDYVLAASLEGVRAEVPVRMTDALIARLPMALESERLRGALRLHTPNLLTVRLQAPLADGEVGARNQQRLQDELRNRLTDTTFEPGAVLLRSYYGEICGCNPRALHEYLHNHPETPGSPYKIYWAIKDYSVHVPDGGIPVLHDSTEWYRLLHDAQYYMDNMHQPLYHKKPAHQTQIQTFHGYPFKQMGLSHWTSQGRDIAHIQSYLDRAADWDYLISPATYGTGPLAHEFGYPHKPLEIGYPRNDIFFSPHKNTITTTTRQRLGIQPHQTAILYAPTFRDALSLDDNTAAMVDHLNLNQLTTELGPNYVILVRGHAFNARLPQRINTHTTTGHHTIIDVTDYPDIAELCLASDAAILDYSSLRFDYALTGKPMIFMVPDLHQYQNETRGSLWRYEPTAPGPLATTTTDIIKNIHNLQQTHHNYTNAYQTFHRDFLDLDDGNATQRLTQTIFGRQSEAPES